MNGIRSISDFTHHAAGDEEAHQDNALEVKG